VFISFTLTLMGVKYQVFGFIVIVLTICALYCSFSTTLHVLLEDAYPADVHFRKGLDFLSQDSLEKAEKSFTEAVVSQPNFALNHYYLAEVYVGQGEFESAVTAYSQTLEIDPEFYPACYSLALLLGNAEGHQEAIVLLKRTIMLNPEYIEAYQELARLYIETGDFKSAEAVYESLEKLGQSAQR
jgi:tetratricopeptide (TPR) repeat protein